MLTTAVPLPPVMAPTAPGAPPPPPRFRMPVLPRPVAIEMATFAVAPAVKVSSPWAVLPIVMEFKNPADPLSTVARGLTVLSTGAPPKPGMALVDQLPATLHESLTAPVHCWDCADPVNPTAMQTR